MRILVTGATGFIGNSLVDNLLNEGHEVIPLGRSLKSWSSEYIKKNLVRVDLNNDQLPEFGEIDCICLLASEQPRKNKPWSKYHKINAEQVLMFAEKKINQLIYISTSTVNLVNNIPNPNNYYGLSKFVGEKFLKINRKNFKQISILRFPSVIGINHKAGVINDLKNWILENKKIDLFDNGLKKRNILHVDDAVLAIVLAINKHKYLDNYEEFNIGSKDSIAMKEIVKSMIRLIGKNVNVEFSDIKTEFKDVFMDNTKAIKKLGYFPITVEDTIKKFLRDYNYEV